VRINVQLIDARSDSHLWAETYDRELTAANIFAIQSEVATAVAAALRTTLTPAEQGRVRAVPTRNLQAWEAYQAGRSALEALGRGESPEWLARPDRTPIPTIAVAVRAYMAAKTVPRSTESVLMTVISDIGVNRRPTLTRGCGAICAS
jgi:hypothetical protein